MSVTRRNAIAGAAVAGIGLVTAGAKAIAGNVVGDPSAAALASSRRWSGGPSLTPSPSPTSTAFGAAPTASATMTPSEAATAAASASAPGSASASPTPIASRTMPVSPSAGTSATATASASAAPKPSVFGGAGLASGASCIGAADGQFGTWRGRAAQVASTWSQDGKTWALDSGGEYSAWKGDLDFAPQYDLGSTFTWSALAGGQYDSRLRSDLQSLKSAWGSRTGTLYYRFQHEFNGDWYRWAVTQGDTASMRQGWARMAGVFRGVFGSDRRFKIVWGVNGGSAPKGFSDIRDAYPGDAFVDVISIDYYDFFKPQNASDWTSAQNAKDSGGGPVGFAAWQAFAQAHGKPLSLSEWGNQYGDNPFYIQMMHDYIARIAYSGSGSAAGKVIYEVYFNQVFDGSSISGGGDFRVMANGGDLPGRPNAARTYRQLFGS